MGSILAASLICILSVNALGAPLPVAGSASYYSAGSTDAAAGPKLRQMLGPDWRGQWVTVTRKGRSITVQLLDWCQCYKGERRERIIDLPKVDFAKLAPTWKGVIKVTVNPLAPPATDTGTD